MQAFDQAAGLGELAGMELPPGVDVEAETVP
jgi:hypothetical protein